MVTLKVKGDTQVVKLAGAIAKTIRRDGEVCVSVVGSHALNQATKAVIIARGFLHQDETPSDLVCQPCFQNQTIGSDDIGFQELTIIMLNISKADYDPKKAIPKKVVETE